MAKHQLTQRQMTENIIDHLRNLPPHAIFGFVCGGDHIEIDPLKFADFLGAQLAETGEKVQS